mmetsp:Transcript_90283/g.274078  ORF Transcript_90283/g.274078 Transcript_90283/m.274078 type:complete len:581 (-) Transcript_90283:70-1812(-)
MQRPRPMHGKDLGTYTTNPAQRQVPFWPGVTEPLEEFSGLPIPRSLLKALRARGIEQPSGIQELVIPRLATGECAILHAPTGAGKTLAYLLPIMARLQPTMHLGMQALILVPSPELALQITREVRWITDQVTGNDKVCWFNPQVPSSMLCEVLLSRKSLWDAMRKDSAIVVSTPGLICNELRAAQTSGRKYRETSAYYFGSNINCVVLDEGDVIISSHRPVRRGATRPAMPGPSELVVEFVFDIVRSRYRNRHIQLLCASATANCSKVRNTLERLLARKWTKRRDAARRVIPVMLSHSATVGETAVEPNVDEAGQMTMQVPKSITHTACVVDVDQPDDLFQQERLLVAARIVRKLKGSVLVFVPDSVRLDAMVMFLREAGVSEAAKYRCELGLGMTAEALEEEEELEGPVLQLRQPKKRIAAMDHRDPGYNDSIVKRSQDFIASYTESVAEGERSVLVAKATAARGVHLDGVRYVVMPELPTSATMYLHIAGRTGRMGKPGTVITVVTPKEWNSVCYSLENRLNISFKEWDLKRAKAIEPLAEAEAEAGAEAEAEAQAEADAPAESLEDLDAKRLTDAVL